MGSLAIPSELHFVKGIDPVADMNNGTVYSDIIEVGGEGIMFLYYKGVSTGGTDNATIPWKHLRPLVPSIMICAASPT